MTISYHKDVINLGLALRDARRSIGFDKMSSSPKEKQNAYLTSE